MNNVPWLKTELQKHPPFPSPIVFSITCLIIWRLGGKEKQGGRKSIYLHSPGIVHEPCLGLHPWRQIAVKTEKQKKKKEERVSTVCLLPASSVSGMFSSLHCDPTESKALTSFSYKVYLKENQGRWHLVIGYLSASSAEESYLRLFRVISMQVKLSRLRELRSLGAYRFPFSVFCEWTGPLSLALHLLQSNF